ncbi:hypothetical protein AOA80_05605 [Methanomassiliicoccales archaeon RumEn M1]|jgi:uncharacterized protein (TIGR00251 family)|nr:hypothetical protein AOA80_05605 [Methanomassiliicoccales archaeon RumEn M1]
MDLSAVLRTVKNGTEIDIMVTPNAKDMSIGAVDEWRRRLVVKVRAVPSEGRANRAVCELFQNALGERVEIAHGATERHKTLFVPLEAEEVRKRLEGASARPR